MRQTQMDVFNKAVTLFSTLCLLEKFFFGHLEAAEQSVQMHSFELNSQTATYILLLWLYTT